MNRAVPYRVSLLLAALLTSSLAAPVLGQEGERELPNEALGQPAKTWFDPKVCSRRADGRLHVLIESAVLAMPIGNVRAALPSRISQVTGGQGKITMRIDRTAGCPETPFPAAAVTLVGLKDIGSGRLVLSETPDNRVAFEAQLAKIRDSGSCTPASGGLVYCKGSRNTASGRQQVAYAIAPDPASRQASGGPLRALCILEGDQRCSVIDDLDGGVRFESAVSGTPTLEKLQQIDAEGRSYVERLRNR